MKKPLLFAAALSCLFAALQARANLVMNGGFELGTVGTTPTDWAKTSSTGIFVVTAAPDGIAGSKDATLTGGGAGVTIGAQLSIALTPGQLYALTFSDYVSPPEPNTNPNAGPYFGLQPAVNGILKVDSLTVDLDGAPAQTITYDMLSDNTFASGHYQTFTLYFTDVSSPGNLTFTWVSSDVSGNGAEQQNIQLDNVSLVAVPEPATMAAGALLLLPFCAVGYRIISNRKLTTV